MVKEAQAEKKDLSERLSMKKCDCEQQNMMRKNLIEKEKKATEEQISTLVSRQQQLEKNLRDSQHVEKTLEAKLTELQAVETENRELKRTQEKILNESRNAQSAVKEK